MSAVTSQICYGYQVRASGMGGMGIVTVFRAYIVITLLHGDPVLGSHLRRCESALANHSTRCVTSDAKYWRPDKPHTKGDLDLHCLRRPYFSFRMNSLMGMESGMESREKSEAHEGASKGMLCFFFCAQCKTRGLPTLLLKLFRSTSTFDVQMTKRMDKSKPRGRMHSFSPCSSEPSTFFDGLYARARST